MRSYDVNDGFEAMRRDVLFTRAMLSASGVHEALARSLDRLLRDWDALDVARRAADDEATACSARSAWAIRGRDALLLDAAAHAGIAVSLPDVASSPSIRAQLAEALRALADADDDVVAQRDQLEAAVRAVTEAAEARDAVAQARTRLALRMHSWRDAANAARRSVHEQLQAHAASEHLASSYADGFFAAPPAASRRIERSVPLVLAG